jgi:hypothetical protein
VVALRADQTLVAWGDNTSGQCTIPPELGAVGQIAAGNAHTVIMLTDGTVLAWGDNTYGQTNVQQALAGALGSQIGAGAFHTLVVKAPLLGGAMPCAGDLTGDREVDGQDLGLFLSSWGNGPEDPADLDLDGDVDGSDLGEMLAAWGPCGGGATPPQP